MVTICASIPDPLEHPLLRQMFEARKRVFVDLLKWNVPVLDRLYEVDEFDDEQAVYLVVSNEAGGHAGSARLLRSVRPHILDSLFPELCASPPPRGNDVLEITRFCLDRSLSADERFETRNMLVSGLVRYALDHDVAVYTGVAEIGWLQQILAFGWRCRPLGLPRAIDGKLLGALRIDVDAATPGLLEANGIWRPEPVAPVRLLEAA